MLRQIQIIAILAFATSCGSTAKKIEKFERACKSTPIQAADLNQFNTPASPGKIQVVRLFRSSSPYCREDLKKISSLFSSGEWKASEIQLILIAFKKPGIESRKTFDHFVRNELADYSLPLETTQIVYLDRAFPSLKEAKSKSGEEIFADWKGIPYGLVFAKNGRLAYRGHFTASPIVQENQYKFITSLQNEDCGTPPGPLTLAPKPQ
ncbi:MAG: hypothetical protein AB7F86_03130 [Bdellovibrionales bacterium]